MRKKVDRDLGASRIRPLALVIGGTLYIAGFLALVYVVDLAKPSLASWLPVQGLLIQPTASPFETPFAPSAQRVSAAQQPPETRTPVLSPTAPIRATESKWPRVAISPCPKPIRALPPRKLSPLTAKPLPRPTPQMARKTPFPAPTLHAIATHSAAVARPQASHSAAVARRPQAAHSGAKQPAGEGQPGSSVMLLPVRQSAALGAGAQLDPRPVSGGALLINPVAAPTPQAASGTSQRQ